MTVPSTIETRQPASVGDPRWWRNAVIYQLYPRSFADGNGDGIGDLAGVRASLPYLRGLGVDALWFTPWYASPGWTAATTSPTTGRSTPTSGPWPKPRR